MLDMNAPADRTRLTEIALKHEEYIRLGNGYDGGPLNEESMAHLANLAVTNIFDIEDLVADVRAGNPDSVEGIRILFALLWAAGF